MTLIPFRNVYVSGSFAVVVAMIRFLISSPSRVGRLPINLAVM